MCEGQPMPFAHSWLRRLLLSGRSRIFNTAAGRFHGWLNEPSVPHPFARVSGERMGNHHHQTIEIHAVTYQAHSNRMNKFMLTELLRLV